MTVIVTTNVTYWCYLTLWKEASHLLGALLSLKPQLGGATELCDIWTPIYINKLGFGFYLCPAFSLLYDAYTISVS